MGQHVPRGVLFVALSRGIGGSTRSFATILAHLGAEVTRIVATPRNGALVAFLKERSLAEVYVPLPTPRNVHLRRLSRSVAAGRIALAAWRNRRELVAIHANGPEELNVVVPASLITRIPVVLWSHARGSSAWMKRLAPLWRRLLPGLRLATVSDVGRRVLVDIGLADREQIAIIPNPIDPSDVVGATRPPSDRIAIGYLGSDAPYKGFQFLPEVIELLTDIPVHWWLFTNQHSVDNEATWRRLHHLPKDRVSFPGKVQDVRQAYARCDIVFCPSLQDTLPRVPAEAMLNGIPVVASDLEPMRDLLGNEEAGVLFPVGDIQAAAGALRRLVIDGSLRRTLGEAGRARARAFEPRGIAKQLAGLYGLEGR